MIHSNRHLIELDFSYANITLQNFYQLTKALANKENDILQSLSFRGIN